MNQALRWGELWEGGKKKRKSETSPMRGRLVFWKSEKNNKNGFLHIRTAELAGGGGLAVRGTCGGKKKKKSA